MNFFCIADRESSIGFKLAGIETREAGTRAEAQEALQVARSTEGVGIILITSKVALFLREQIDELIYETQYPLILEIPSRGETKKGKSASDFLKELIGISV